MTLRTTATTLAIGWILVAAAPPILAQSSAAARREFVRARAGTLVIGDRPYHFVGANFWFAPYLGAERGGDRARLVRELDHLKGMGITNLRIMASSEGPSTTPQRVHPAIQESPGVYDENLLGGLDFLLAELEKRDMRAVLILGNFFQWTGGLSQYVSWATGTPIPLPETAGNSWDDFQNYSTRFFASDSAQRLFESYARALLTRRNRITGEQYRNEPTIMSWQLSNEPRGFARGDAFVRWVNRAAAFVKQNAPHQLVSLGGEGKLAQPLVNTRFEDASRSPNIDYLTVHVWIENWGWYDPANPGATFDRSVGRALGYLADHVAIARAMKKPIVFEEFGVSRDGRDYASTAPTTVRDRFLTIVLEAVHHLAAEGEPVAGANVWSWSGESTPARPGLPWHDGDPLTGDPPHERQGWYSIYNADSSTLAILSDYARRMDTVTVRPWALRSPAMPKTSGAGSSGHISRGGVLQ
jgi:mannan endo-1,4-beta-mannosidase